MLQSLENKTIGIQIGNFYIGSPTCADDQLLIPDNSADMKAMIQSCNKYLRKHQYTLHPEKSSITVLRRKVRAQTPKTGSSTRKIWPRPHPLPTYDWTGTLKSSAQTWIKLATRTTYALMGAGLHGQNGLGPAISTHIITKYVIPRLLYGLEATVLLKKQREDITSYYNNLLRRIQGLPKWPAVRGHIPPTR